MPRCFFQTLNIPDAYADDRFDPEVMYTNTLRHRSVRDIFHVVKGIELEATIISISIVKIVEKKVCLALSTVACLRIRFV